MTDEELGEDYPTQTESNMKDLPPSTQPEEDEDTKLRRSRRLFARHNKNTMYHNGVDIGLEDDTPYAKNSTISVTTKN